MTLNFRDGVSILKLAIYAPYLFATLYVCWKHGFMKGSGWIFLSIFCVIRIVGAAAQLASISSKSTTPFTIAAVTDAIGLSPLLLASLGLISRSFYSILKSPWNMIFSVTVLRIPQLVCTVALILCIVGATSAKHISDFGSESTVHIGIILFLVAFLLILALTIIAGITCRQSGRGEKVVIIAVACSLPFILTRLLYSVIAVFGHDASFNLVTGSVAINLVMAVLEEIVVVAIYTITGIKIDIIPKGDQSNSAGRNMAYRAGRGDFGMGKLGLLSLLVAGVRELLARGEKDTIPRDEMEKHGQAAPRYTARNQGEMC